MPAFPASQIPVRARRGAGPGAVSCGLAAGARHGLFQGWYCPNDSAGDIRTAAAMKLRRKAPAMYYFSGCCGRAASGCGPMAMSVSPFASKTLTILSHRCAVLYWLQGDGYRIAGFKRSAPPASRRHGRGILCFDNPAAYRACIILRVKFQETVRIGPNPLRHRSLQRELFLGIEGRGTVMSDERHCRCKYGGSNEQHFHNSSMNHLLTTRCGWCWLREPRCIDRKIGF